MKIRRWLATLLLTALLVPILAIPSGITAQAAASKEIQVAAMVSYTPKEQILKRINEIRREACNEGITLYGRKLTPADYVEIKWSTDMEEIAMIRATEASYMFDHTRPDGSSWYTVESSQGLSSSCEIIASIGSALSDIELWYMEKSSLVNGNPDQAGHYIALINPDYRSVGIASAGVSVGEFSYDTYESNGRDKQIYNKNAYLNVNIAIDPEKSQLAIYGDKTIASTGVGGLVLALPCYSYWGPQFLPIYDEVEWTSSNPEIVSVDENGNVTGHKEGSATITAKHRGIEVTTKVTAVKGEWKHTANGWWYDLKNGKYPANRFMIIDGNAYYFDKKGYMATGWKKLYGSWYYFGSNGALRLGWQKIDNRWYYLGTSGNMSTGWEKIDGSWYYFAPGGAMQTGWVKYNGKWYYMNAGGSMRTGWSNVGGYKYYHEPSGEMVTGWKQIDGKWYYFSAGGAMQTGWVKPGTEWYYLDSNGEMVTNQWIGNFYLKEDGRMARNEWIDQYYVGEDGKWVKGKTK